MKYRPGQIFRNRHGHHFVIVGQGQSKTLGLFYRVVHVEGWLDAGSAQHTRCSYERDFYEWRDMQDMTEVRIDLPKALKQQYELKEEE